MVRSTHVKHGLVLHVRCWVKVSYQVPGISLKPGPSAPSEGPWLCLGAHRVAFGPFGHGFFVAREVAHKLKTGELCDTSASSTWPSPTPPGDFWNPIVPLACPQPPSSTRHWIKRKCEGQKLFELRSGKNRTAFAVWAPTADTLWGLAASGTPLFSVSSFNSPPHHPAPGLFCQLGEL